MDISQEQLLRGEDYTTIERQFLYNDHILALSHTAALNGWDRIEEVGKMVESFTKNLQGQKETFSDFLQGLTLAVNKMIENSEARQMIIESLVFENAILNAKGYLVL